MANFDQVRQSRSSAWRRRSRHLSEIFYWPPWSFTTIADSLAKESLTLQLGRRNIPKRPLTEGSKESKRWGNSARIHFERLRSRLRTVKVLDAVRWLWRSAESDNPTKGYISEILNSGLKASRVLKKGQQNSVGF